jgi:hypothetical protein
MVSLLLDGIIEDDVEAARHRDDQQVKFLVRAAIALGIA